MNPLYRRMLRGMRAREEHPSTDMAGGAVWSLYILECRDGSLYTGVTTDIDRRLREHQEGKASRYTRTRRPVVLVHREECGSRSRALSRECAVKSLSRGLKEKLISGGKPVPAMPLPAPKAGPGKGERRIASRRRRPDSGCGAPKK